jgi:ABC-type amino acid transport substrate-binding protein
MKRVMTAYPGLSLKVTQKNGAEHIVSSAPTHFMFNNTQADLVKAVDGALRTLKANGKMNEIQQSVLGEVYVDFTKQ